MSLFDTIMDEGDKPESQDVVDSKNVNADSNGSGEPAAPEPSWWWDENTPGQGERPSWLPDKYKSAEDVAKAYSELQKKLGSAPDQYDWSKGNNWVDPDYEPFHEMENYLRGKAVPQDVVDVMLTTVDKFLNEFNINQEEERKALGDNAPERLRILNNWVKANFSEETQEALISSMNTAASVKAIEEMRTMMIENNTTIPTGNEAPVPSYSIEDVTREMQQNLEQYKNDPKYRAEIQAKFEKVSQQSSYVDKRY